VDSSLTIRQPSDRTMRSERVVLRSRPISSDHETLPLTTSTRHIYLRGLGSVAAPDVTPEKTSVRLFLYRARPTCTTTGALSHLIRRELPDGAPRRPSMPTTGTLDASTLTPTNDTTTTQHLRHHSAPANERAMTSSRCASVNPFASRASDDTTSSTDSSPQHERHAACSRYAWA
jgi:hypothetical protein